MPDFFEEVKAAVIDDAALSQGDTQAQALSELWTQPQAPFPTVGTTLQQLPFPVSPHHSLTWIPFALPLWSLCSPCTPALISKKP